VVVPPAVPPVVVPPVVPLVVPPVVPPVVPVVPVAGVVAAGAVSWRSVRFPSTLGTEGAMNQ
jgi:hypothetical protein